MARVASELNIQNRCVELEKECKLSRTWHACTSREQQKRQKTCKTARELVDLDKHFTQLKQGAPNYSHSIAYVNYLLSYRYLFDETLYLNGVIFNLVLHKQLIHSHVQMRLASDERDSALKHWLLHAIETWKQEYDAIREEFLAHLGRTAVEVKQAFDAWDRLVGHGTGWMNEYAGL